LVGLGDVTFIFVFACIISTSGLYINCNVPNQPRAWACYQKSLLYSNYDIYIMKI
jgi:hypothetical protein